MPSCDVSRRGFLALSGSLMLTAGWPAVARAAPPPRGAPNVLAASPVELLMAEFERREDRFDCERQWRQLGPAMGRLRAALLAGGEGLEALLAPGADCGLLPSQWRELRRDHWVTVTAGVAPFRGGPPALRAWLAAQPPIRLAELDCTAISAADGGAALRTLLRFSMAAAARWQAKGAWEVEWRRDAGGQWRIASWRTTEATMAQASGPAFVDISAAAFGRDPSYGGQMLRDTNYWRTVLDAAAGVDIFGNYGVSAGDADGDGQDELYVCQPQGLPNRLYRRRSGAGAEYEDIAAAAGVDLLDATPMALFADLRNSGRQDLVLITQSQPLVFFNDGRGGYTLAAEAIPLTRSAASLTGAALADYDGDGYLDLYVCSYGYFQGAGNHALPVPYYDAHDGPPNHLYRNRGDGTFEDVTEASGLGRGNNRYSFACIWADIAGSGRPDLFVINDFGQNDLYHNLGSGRFALVPGGLPGHGAGMSAAAADFAGRGLELYVGNMWAPDGLRVTADAAFRRRYAGAAGGQMREMAAGNRLYAASGTGNAGPGLQPRACGAANAGWAWSCGAVDVANSGRPDLFCVNGFLTGPEDPGKPKPAVDDFFWQQIIARSPLAGQPVTPNYRAAWGAGFRLAHRDHSWNGGQRNVLFLNLGDGQFADASAAGGVDFADDGRAFAVFDCDGDGDCDLALRSRTGPQLRLLRNDAAGVHGSLAVKLRGTRGNRDAIGAQLRLATAAGSQVRELGAGSGFLSQHSKRLIFGLGDERSAELRVRWPGGARQDFPALEAGYEYILTEGQPTPVRRPLAPRGSATAAPATARAIPMRFSTPLVEALALPAVATAGLAPARAGRARLLWISPRDSVASAGLGLVLIRHIAAEPFRLALVAWDTAPEPFRTFWRTTLRFLYDRRRELAMPTGLLLGQAAGAGGGEALLKVYWGGAPQEELATDLARPPQGGAEVLPFPGRALLCSFRRDTRALGAAMQTAGLHGAAELYLGQAAAMFPSDAEVFYNLALARRGLRAREQARAAVERALALRPHFAEAENLLGVLAMDAGDTAGAKAQFLLATRDAPELADAWNNLGDAQLAAGELAEADPSLRRAIALAPRFANALNNLGIVSARRGDSRAAEGYFQRALAAQPGDAEAGNNLAVLYAREGQYRKALDTFRALLRAAPDARGATLNCVRLELALHEPGRARRLLAAWLRRHPRDQEARQLEAGSGKSR